MIIIHGTIEPLQVFVDGELLLPEQSQRVYNHSPDGFSWGYSGSGPAQLALAILLEFTQEDLALQLHQWFKTDIIARLPQGKDFKIKLDVRQWIERNKGL